MTRLAHTLATLSDLIAFATVSRDSNLHCIHYLRERLEAAGAACTVQYNTDGSKANIFATIGPAQQAGGIVLCGHTDVVPVAGQPWDTDPFVMHTQDGKSYGRGSCDMKGFIAAAVAVAPEYARLQARNALRRPLHFAFTYDEEIGCFGAQRLTTAMRSWQYRPAMAVVGEPTMMGVVHAHKGCSDFSVHFTGKAGHSSLPHKGVNAIHYAARYIGKILELAETLRLQAGTASAFDPPCSTLQVGKVAGGVAHNVIPDSCRVDWNMRDLAASDKHWVLQQLNNYTAQELLPEMQTLHPGAAIALETVSEVESLVPLRNSAAADLIASLLCDSRPPQSVSFATEAGLFQKIGIDTVICGPGSIEQAHKANEFVAHDQLQKAIDLLVALQPQLTG